MFLVTTIKNSGIDNTPEYITNNIKTSDISAYMLNALNLKKLAWKNNINPVDDIDGLIPSSKIDGLSALAFKDKIVEDDISGWLHISVLTDLKTYGTVDTLTSADIDGNIPIEKIEDFKKYGTVDTVDPDDINGNISISKIDGLKKYGTVDTLTSADIDGKIPTSKIEGLKTYGTKNTLTYHDIDGKIPTTKIDGLSALAFKDQIEISDVNSLQTELDSKVSSVVVMPITDETNGEPLATISVNGTETTIYGGTGNGQSGVANIGIGTIVAFAGEGVIPENTLLCDGREVSKSDYELLYAVIGDRYGNAAEGMFKLPDLRNRFIEGCLAISDVGTYLKAGLPNITGTLDTFKGDYSGAF
jgi:hypothetical protein